MGEKRILWFSEINENNRKNVGEKAFYLAEANNKRLQVKNATIPQGFVLTKESIQNFFESTKTNNAICNIIEETNTNNQDELKRAEEKIKDLILRTNFPKEIEDELFESYEALSGDKLDIERGSAYDILTNSKEPEFVAVRPSNEKEEGDSYFNIKGRNAIIKSIKKCLQSFFTAEKIKENKNQKINSAIIIQKQIQSDKSGILYLNDTYTIESIWGIGCGLRQEEIDKDIYEIRRDGRILNKTIKNKKYAVTRDSSGSLKIVRLKEGYSQAQTLEDFEIQKLADVALRFENIFKEKLEFHFAIEDDNIYVVTIQKQTQLPDKKDLQPTLLKEIDSTESIPKKEVQETTDLEFEKPNIIIPVKNLTKTKTNLIINNSKDFELSKDTLIKSGIINIEETIKSRGIHPLKYIQNYNTKGYEEFLSAELSNISKNLNTVWIKLSDFTSKDFKDLEGAPELKEENPLMGLTGIRFLLSQPELLKRELKAANSIKQDGKDIGILIPKISSVYELKKVKEFLKDLKIELKIGIILETPAAIQLIKDLLEEDLDAAFFSGDTLTQYLLAIDPNNKNVKEFYDITSPALMYQLEYVIRVCKRRNTLTGFYGKATNNKEMVDYLVKKNIDIIFATPENTNNLAMNIEKAEKKYIEGTDKEQRQYEKTKEKERQQKEIKEFEKIKENQIKTELKSYNKTEETPTQEISTEEAIKAIQKEKEEFLEIEECLPETKEGETLEIENIEEESEEISEDPVEVQKLLEKEKEEFKDEIENVEDLGPNDRENKDLAEVNSAIEEIEKKDEVNPSMGLPKNSTEAPSSVEEAMRLIEEHNNAKPQETDVEKAIREIEEHNKKAKEKESPIEEIKEETIEEPEIHQEVLYDPTKKENPKELIQEDIIEISEEEELEEINDQDFEDNLLDILDDDEPELHEEDLTEEKDDPLGIF